MAYLSNILKSKKVFNFSEPQLHILGTSAKKTIQKALIVCLYIHDK